MFLAAVNNVDMLIKAIVVMSIMAIWAITSLFNRETAKPTPLRPTGPLPPPPPRPRPGEPTMRWSPTPPPASPGPRRVSIGDDDILIISNEPPRTSRPGQARPIVATATGPRRPARSKPIPKPTPRPAEPPPSRPRLAGVSQNVSQQIAKSSLTMAPMDTMPSATGLTSLGLASAPSAPIHAPTITISAVAAALADPVRLREAFIINEILQPPLALRGVRPFRR